MGKPHTNQEPATAIAYYRVSTQKQGASGLGLDAQRASVAAYARAHGLTIANEYTEIETGTRKRTRPQIAKAIAEAKASNAILLIAKLDRLARNVHFISGLMESKVQFVAVDMPVFTPLTLHILAAVAEEEARMISTRTKAALKAAKARGTKLGKPENLTHEAQQKGARANHNAAVTAGAHLANYVRMLTDKGLSTRQIAAQLNADGYRTRQGRAWTAMQVWRLAQRMPEGK